VRARIREKIRSYGAYHFTNQQSRALNIFFDLAQEFDETDRLHLLSVLILHVFFHLEAELHCKNEEGALSLRTPRIAALPAASPPLVHATRREGDVLYLPVRGKQSPNLSGGQAAPPDTLLGVLAVKLEPSAADATLFLEKFANRVGYCLHNRILAERNLRHVLFLRNLAQDIGHNVITPNMRIKLLLLRLEEQIGALGALSGNLPAAGAVEEIRSLQETLRGQVKTLTGHFQNGALFLESLLRQSHFDLGRYDLRCARLDIRSQVVLPQLERYRASLEERGVLIDPESFTFPDRPCLVLADLGLISQTLANLLGNAVKYAKPHGEDASPRMRCEVGIAPDAFPGRRAGVKVSVSSTGPPIAPEDESRLFLNSFRAANSTGEHGTGHGLFFVREIVAAHHGISGYERLPRGNSFYFLLPLEETPPPA
jgi:signal transduction histidine kinase